MIRYLRDRNYRSVKPLGEEADGSRAGAADGADAGADTVSRVIDFVDCFVFFGAPLNFDCSKWLRFPIRRFVVRML